MAVARINTLASYENVRALCGVAIIALSIKSRAKLFFATVPLGFIAQHYLPDLSQKDTCKKCASGCTDIVGQSLGIKLDPRLNLIIATIFFCCHLEHHGREMVPVAGFIAGARLYHYVMGDS